MISISNCSVKISGNTFNDAAGMMYENVAITTNGGASIISNNNFNSCGLNLSDNSTISNNVIGGGMGIYGGSPFISNNTISGGSSYFFIGRDWDRDYYTVAIEDQSSPTLTGNTIGSIAFNMNGNGYMYNIFNALITGNIITGGIGIGGGTGTVVISNNIISGAGVSGGSAVSTTINNNLIININIGLQIGDAIVENNTIANCSTAIQLNSAVSPIISGNNIENYSQHSIQLVSTSNNINAPNNWWGTTNQQAINQSIYDLKNDFNLGKVNFLPILNSPNPNAPEIPTFTLSTSAGTGGSISPSGPLIVIYGNSQIFNITANTGYHIVDVEVNGTSVGAVTSYAFNNIQASYVISATFASNTSPSPTSSQTPTSSSTPIPTATAAATIYSPTASPSETPAIPELAPLAIIILLAGALLAIIGIKKQKSKKS
ncbi:MAG: hypothetical protein ABSB10_04580 [Candidatus Bathyarchaeia archaeon]